MDASKRYTGTNNLALGMAKTIAGQADHAKNPWGDLNIKNLEMEGKLLTCIALEGIVGTKNLRYKHVGLFSDNMAAVPWTQRGTKKKSAAAGRLIRVLDLQQ